MKIATIAAALLCASASFASAEIIAVPDATRTMPTELVMVWWERSNTTCVTQINGEVNLACLDRTALANVLEKRGYCQTVLPVGGKRWQQCIVGKGGASVFTGGDPSLQKYLMDRNSYFANGINPSVQPK